jgi:hypothetical protein
VYPFQRVSSCRTFHRFQLPERAINKITDANRKQMLERLYPEYSHLCSFSHGLAEANLLKKHQTEAAPLESQRWFPVWREYHPASFTIMLVVVTAYRLILQRESTLILQSLLFCWGLMKSLMPLLRSTSLAAMRSAAQSMSR